MRLAGKKVVGSAGTPASGWAWRRPRTRPGAAVVILGRSAEKLDRARAAGRIRPGGSITFISGLAARKGFPRLVAAAANAGIEAVARTLAVELAPARVNTVCAGVIDTEMLDRVFGEKRAEVVAAVSEKLPVKRIGRPEDIADAVLFLMATGSSPGQRSSSTAATPWFNTTGIHFDTRQRRPTP